MTVSKRNILVWSIRSTPLGMKELLLGCTISGKNSMSHKEDYLSGANMLAIYLFESNFDQNLSR